MYVMLLFRTISESLVLRESYFNFYFGVHVKREQSFTVNVEYIST